MMHRTIAILSLSVPLCAIGCRPSETVPVTGAVTMNGQPVNQAEVIFTPAKGRVASGVTDDGGKFALSTNKAGDGAVPGEHVVSIGEYYPPGKPPPMSGGPPPRVPRKYTDMTQTSLRAKVERGKTNDFKFELTK